MELDHREEAEMDALHVFFRTRGYRRSVMLSPGGEGGSDQPLHPATTQIIRCRATLGAKVTDVKLHHVQDDTFTSPRLPD